MLLKNDESVIQIGIDYISVILKDKISCEKNSYQKQSLSIDLVDLLAQQILIPILVSLTSSVIYDFLKGKVISRMSRKETEVVISKLKQCTIDTNVALSEECKNALFEELIPMGLKENDILLIYEEIKIKIQQHVEEANH